MSVNVGCVWHSAAFLINPGLAVLDETEGFLNLRKMITHLRSTLHTELHPQFIFWKILL